MKKFILALVFVTFLFVLVGSEKTLSQQALCSGINSYPYSGTGSFSSSNANMHTLNNQAMTQCETTLRASLASANAQCAQFCLAQSNSQVLCLPKPTASKTTCAIPNLNLACNVNSVTMTISCTVSDNSILKCACSRTEGSN